MVLLTRSSQQWWQLWNQSEIMQGVSINEFLQSSDRMSMLINMANGWHWTVMIIQAANKKWSMSSTDPSECTTPTLSAHTPFHNSQSASSPTTYCSSLHLSSVIVSRSYTHTNCNQLIYYWFYLHQQLTITFSPFFKIIVGAYTVSQNIRLTISHSFRW